jgi:hypothetical protein
MKISEKITMLFLYYIKLLSKDSGVVVGIGAIFRTGRFWWSRARWADGRFSKPVAFVWHGALTFSKFWKSCYFARGQSKSYITSFVAHHFNVPKVLAHGGCSPICVVNSHQFITRILMGVGKLFMKSQLPLLKRFYSTHDTLQGYPSEGCAPALSIWYALSPLTVLITSPRTQRAIFVHSPSLPA